MVTAKEIQKVIDPRARWIAKDKDGTVRWYMLEPYIEGLFWNHNTGLAGTLGVIEVEEFKDAEWTECCLELEPDYSKWCGCLCYFWDDDVGEKTPAIGILEATNLKEKHCMFKLQNGAIWYHCRPVRRDEVEFVED